MFYVLSRPENINQGERSRRHASIAAAKRPPLGETLRLTILFHPDYTVGPGVTPDLLTQGLRKKSKALAGYTAGGELHPALRMPGGSAQRLLCNRVVG